MRKSASLLALFVLGFATLSLFGVQTVTAQYNGHGMLPVSPISVTSPSNNTYNSDFLNLTVTTKIWLSPNSASMTYSLDGKESAAIPLEATFEPLSATRTYPNGTTTTADISIFSDYIITGYVALPKLPEGSHKITVDATYSANNQVGYDTKTVYFTINDGTPPVISILSLENKTYNQNNLQLNFTIDEPTSWIGYCLDGKTNVTTSGNTTIAALSSGLHILTIYANDTAENMGTSGPLNFEISQPSAPSPSVSPSLMPSPTPTFLSVSVQPAQSPQAQSTNMQQPELVFATVAVGAGAVIAVAVLSVLQKRRQR